MNFKNALISLRKELSLLDSEKAIIDDLYNEYHIWSKNLTEEEQRLIRKYTKNSHDNSKPNRFFERLNRAVRGEYVGKDEDKLLKYAAIISNAIKKHPIQQTIVCYRGVDDDLFSHTAIGTQFKFRQFISTSIIEKGALKKPYKYVIVVPEGAIGAYIDELSAFKGQYEFLLDYECEYKLTAKSGKTVYLEVIV
jgi:hypothetical protein